MIDFSAQPMMGTIAAHHQTQETNMTHIHPHIDFNFVNVLLRWLQTYYVRKLERYAATHNSTCFH